MGVLFGVIRDKDLTGDERLQSRLVGTVHQKVVMPLFHWLPIHGFWYDHMVMVHGRPTFPRDRFIAQRDKIALEPRLLERLAVLFGTRGEGGTMRMPFAPMNVYFIGAECHVIRELHVEMNITSRADRLVLFGCYQPDHRFLVIHFFFLARREQRAAQYNQAH